MQVCIKKINDRKTLKKLICHQMHAKHQNLHLLNFPHKLAPQNIKKNSHQKLTKHWRAQKKKKRNNWTNSYSIHYVLAKNRYLSCIS